MKNQEFSKVLDMMLYEVETVKALRHLGTVAKSEFDVKR